jgi:hypothetical protein
MYEINWADFWEGQQEPTSPEAFVRGFIAGAAEVFDEVEDKL